MSDSNLYYVGDPMCSWCFAFQPTIAAIRTEFMSDLTFHYVMGGLAPDSDEPMPVELQGYVQENWRQIESQTPTRFNWDFWTKCQPRRSTYASCRSVIAVGFQDEAAIAPMFEGIQRAYYLGAKNPSEIDTLIDVADQIDVPIDLTQLRQDLASTRVEASLQEHFELRRRIQGRSFPSLILEKDGHLTTIQEGWSPTKRVLANLRQALP